MTPPPTVKSFIKKSTGAMVLLALIRGCLRALPVLMVGLLLLSGLDRWVLLAAWGRQMLWVLFVGVALAAWVSSFIPLVMFSLKERSRNLSLRQPVLRRDDLRLVLELSSSKQNDPVSIDLRDEYVRRISDQLLKSNPFWCFPQWNWKKPLLVGVISLLMVGSLRAFFPALLPLESRTLFPFWSFDVSKIIKIEPGDADVPMGKDVQIHLTVLELGESSNSIGGKPILSVKTGESWLELEASIEGNREYSFIIKNLVSPLLYRVQWRGVWSRRFKLTPVEPLSIKTFEVRLQPPEYTGKSVLEQTSPEISGLAGTQVEMKVTTSVPIKKILIQFSDKRVVDAMKVDGLTASFRFNLTVNESYDFQMTDELGVIHQTESAYPIHVLEDQPPTITLLSPDQDVVIGEKETLPITYDARDDHGLGEVTLEWEAQSGIKKSFRVASFDNPVESSLATTSWDLALQKFSPGAVVRFRLGVVDKNKVTGPGKAWTDWRIIELRSFELEHAVIEKALEAWREKAVEALAQITTLQKKLDLEKPDIPTLSNEFNETSQKLNRLEEALRQITNKMEQDPMADYGVWLEHTEMEKNLSLMNQTTVKSAQAAFQTQNKPAASNHLENIANELERMTALSEDLSKSQKARDVTDASESLEKKGDDLMSLLQDAKSDPETKAMLNQLLAEAQKDLMEMAQAIQEMPEELPDDFVNQEAIKDLNIGKSQDILSQIAEAIKQGDMKKALSLAQKFSEAAKQMKKQLNKAHESFLKSNSAEELGKKISEQSQALEKITEEQRQLLSETQKLASKQLDEIMKEQESLLAKLADRQAKVLAAARPIASLTSQGPAMELVLQEFKSKRVDKSKDLLNGIVGQVALVQMSMQASSATAAALEPIHRIHDEELSILEALKNPPSPKPHGSQEDQGTYSKLESQQKEVQSKTQSLKQELQQLSRKTASLGVPLMQALGSAGSEMKSASSELSGKNGVSAQRSEERALDALLQGQAELQAAQSAMSEMASQQGGEEGSGEGEGEGSPGGGRPGGGRGNGPKVILRSGGSSSGRGKNTGKVTLPRADDFRAPKAFREDLMESLKENYPKIYEDIIHSYYKRLAQ